MNRARTLKSLRRSQFPEKLQSLRPLNWWLWSPTVTKSWCQTRSDTSSPEARVISVSNWVNPRDSPILTLITSPRDRSNPQQSPWKCRSSTLWTICSMMYSPSFKLSPRRLLSLKETEGKIHPELRKKIFLRMLRSRRRTKICWTTPQKIMTWCKPSERTVTESNKARSFRPEPGNSVLMKKKANLPPPNTLCDPEEKLPRPVFFNLERKFLVWSNN